MLQGDQQCFSEKSADISRGIYIDKIGLTYDIKQLALLWDPPKTTQFYILYKLAAKLYMYTWRSTQTDVGSATQRWDSDGLCSGSIQHAVHSHVGFTTTNLQTKEQPEFKFKRTLLFPINVYNE